MRLVDIHRLLLPILDHTLFFFFFFGIQQNVTRPDPRNIYSNWYGLIKITCNNFLLVLLTLVSARVSHNDNNIIKIIIIESVDSITRDGTDTPYM